MAWLQIDYQKGNGLVAAIIQDYLTRDVLMLGYVSQGALRKTVESGFVYFWSRSRKKLWMKGEKSSNKLKVKAIYVDCDNDTLLVKVEVSGSSVCHTGASSCFDKKFDKKMDIHKIVKI